MRTKAIATWAHTFTDNAGSIHALVNHEWGVVPPEAILPDRLNRDPLHAHICAHPQTGYIYCYLRAGAGS
jgi:hypothetical protein